MNNTQLVLIDILRSFATDYSQKPNIDNADMELLFKLSKKHSVVGIVAHVLDKFALYDSKEMRDKFMHEYDRTIMNMLSREASAMKLCKELNNLSIKHIFFKGMKISAAYPIPYLRTYGDADIVILEKDVKKLCEFMAAQGYEHSLADAGVVNVFKKNKEHYEFHKNLNVSNLTDKSYFEKLWDYVHKDNGHTYEFEHNFHLCYLITHLEKHVYGSGAGLRMYLDIVLYINKYKDCLELKNVKDTLSAFGLGDFFNTVLFVCHKWFGFSLPDWVVPMKDTVYNDMCEFTFSGGVFGDQSAEKNVENALRHNMSSGRKNARASFLMERIFPPFSELERMYPRFEGKPLLAPLAWFNHLFRFFRDKKSSRVKVITSADTHEAQKKKEFLESIGSVH